MLSVHLPVPCFSQVFQARWQQTLVAVKVLLNTGVDPSSKDALSGITLSDPQLVNLQKVCAGWWSGALV